MNEFCTPEQARRLDKAGLKYNTGKMYYRNTLEQDYIPADYRTFPEGDDYIRAYNVGQLIDSLPIDVQGMYHPELLKTKDGYTVLYYCNEQTADSESDMLFEIGNDDLIEVLVQTIEYLAKSGYLRC